MIFSSAIFWFTNENGIHVQQLVYQAIAIAYFVEIHIKIWFQDLIAMIICFLMNCFVLGCVALCCEYPLIHFPLVSELNILGSIMETNFPNKKGKKWKENWYIKTIDDGNSRQLHEWISKQLKTRYKYVDSNLSIILKSVIVNWRIENE